MMKNLIKRCIFTGAQFSGVYHSPRSRKKGPVCLFWHSVEDNSLPLGYLEGTNPTASMFRDHIKFLVENYTPISISDFMDIIEKKTLLHSFSKPPVLLGFDDGYKNVIAQALPILNEFKVPAVFFVIGKILKNPDFVPWHIERKHLIRRAEKKTIVYDNMSLDLFSQQDCAKLVRSFSTSFKTCRSETDRQGLLVNLANLLGVERPVSSDLDEDLRFVSAEDLANLGSSSLLTVASHAMTHRLLASLTYEEQLQELEQSDLLLRKHCPSYYPIISYPDGSFNADTITIASRIYKAGFAVFLGSSYRNLYAYPRIGINYDTVQELAYTISTKRLNYILPLKRFLNVAGIRKVY